MTFDPFAPKEKPEKAGNRETDLIRAVFSTAQGIELLQIWKDKLVYAPVWSSVMPNEHCRHIGGRHSVYRDLITIAERKDNAARGKDRQPDESGQGSGG